MMGSIPGKISGLNVTSLEANVILRIAGRDRTLLSLLFIDWRPYCVICRYCPFALRRGLPEARVPLADKSAPIFYIQSDSFSADFELRTSVSLRRCRKNIDTVVMTRR
jgi:hypothetical protein